MIVTARLEQSTLLSKWNQRSRYLLTFGESPTLDDDAIKNAERYLVRVWAGANVKTTANTFDELRFLTYKSSKGSLVALPPTSSVLLGHIKRCLHSTYKCLTILNTSLHSDPSSFGWDLKDGYMKPQKFLKFLPSKYIVTCNCTGACKTYQCKCRKMGVECVLYCHKTSDKKAACQNS